MKHPVPKKKQSKTRTKRRYKDFRNKVLKRLRNDVKLIDCPQCHNKVLFHHACANCGTYNGKKIINMEKKIEKITKIKA